MTLTAEESTNSEQLKKRPEFKMSRIATPPEVNMLISRTEIASIKVWRTQREINHSQAHENKGEAITRKQLKVN